MSTTAQQNTPRLIDNYVLLLQNNTGATNAQPSNPLVESTFTVTTSNYRPEWIIHPYNYNNVNTYEYGYTGTDPLKIKATFVNNSNNDVLFTWAHHIWSFPRRFIVKRGGKHIVNLTRIDDTYGLVDDAYTGKVPPLFEPFPSLLSSGASNACVGKFWVCRDNHLLEGSFGGAWPMQDLSVAVHGDAQHYADDLNYFVPPATLSRFQSADIVGIANGYGSSPDGPFPFAAADTNSNPSYGGVVAVFTSGGVSYRSLNTTPGTGIRTFFHEFGHLVDFLSPTQAAAVGSSTSAISDAPTFVSLFRAAYADSSLDHRQYAFTNANGREYFADLYQRWIRYLKTGDTTEIVSYTGSSRLSTYLSFMSSAGLAA
jgi:hypothetical protein